MKKFKIRNTGLWVREWKEIRRDPIDMNEKDRSGNIYYEDRAGKEHVESFKDLAKIDAPHSYLTYYSFDHSDTYDTREEAEAILAAHPEMFDPRIEEIKGRE